MRDNSTWKFSFSKKEIPAFAGMTLKMVIKLIET